MISSVAVALQAIQWAEARLSARDATLALVSHDRAFLEALATGFLELDRDGTHFHAVSGPGCYSRFRQVGFQLCLVHSVAAPAVPPGVMSPGEIALGLPEGCVRVAWVCYGVAPHCGWQAIELGHGLKQACLQGAPCRSHASLPLFNFSVCWNVILAIAATNLQSVVFRGLLVMVEQVLFDSASHA